MHIFDTWRRFMFGAFGGVAISLFGALVSRDFFMVMRFGFPDALIVLSGMLARFIFLGLVGGVTTLVTKPKSPRDAFIRGMAVPLLILLLLSFGEWYLRELD